MNKRQTGAEGELLAAEYLKGQGYTILKHNFRCRMGEIDLIAKEGEYLCFVEVKYRAGTSYGLPSEAVTPQKQKKIRRTAEYYLLTQGCSMDTPCRFDVVAVCGNHIRLYRNAFGE